MNEAEARYLLRAELRRYRGMTYGELRGMVGELDGVEVAGKSGARYLVEVDIGWWRQQDTSIHVMLGIDPMPQPLFSRSGPSGGFVIAPSGELVGAWGEALSLGSSTGSLTR